MRDDDARDAELAGGVGLHPFGGGPVGRGTEAHAPEDAIGRRDALREGAEAGGLRAGDQRLRIGFGTESAELDGEDRARLEQYLTGVRELERRLVLAQAWERKPKPVTAAREPIDPADPRAYLAKVKLMYEVSRLAFETDSTRLITLFLDSVNSPAIDVDGIAITDGYHNLSHHGKNASKLKQLEAIDHMHMKHLADLLGQLRAASLLDSSMVLYGSNFGDANRHTTTDMPVIFAGGGFRHGQHLAFPGERNYPLPNLFLSIIERMEIEAKTFASATGTMRGLELKA